jgi:hypothetical protein
MPQPTAQVTGKPGSNSSTLSQRKNPNKPMPEGGAQPAPKDSPAINDVGRPGLVRAS